MATLDWAPDTYWCCSFICVPPELKATWSWVTLIWNLYEEVWRSWGVDAILAGVVLCQGVALSQLGCLSSSRNHTRNALRPLIQDHVPPNQLELRTCIPHCCGDDCQGCSRVWMVLTAWKVTEKCILICVCFKCLCLFSVTFKRVSVFLFTINASCKAETKWQADGDHVITIH